MGKPGVLQSMGLQRVRNDWVIELNWNEAPSGSWLGYKDAWQVGWGVLRGQITGWSQVPDKRRSLCLELCRPSQCGAVISHLCTAWTIAKLPTLGLTCWQCWLLESLCLHNPLDPDSGSWKAHSRHEGTVWRETHSTGNRSWLHPHSLCGLRQGVSPLWSSVSSSVKQGSTHDPRGRSKGPIKLLRNPEDGPEPWGRERMWVNLSTEGSSARLLGGVRPGPLIAWCPGPWSRPPESEESAQGQ